MCKRHLTDEEMLLGISELMRRLGLTRSTAYRAKKRGYFVDGHTNEKASQSLRRAAANSLPPPQEKIPGTRIVLSEAEKRIGPRRLAKRYGISRRRAFVAIKDGYFDCTRWSPLAGGKKWKPAQRSSYDPESRYFRVNLAQAELSYPITKLMRLYCHFGMTVEQARKARQKGYFCPNVLLPYTPMVDQAKFEQFKDELLEEARRGAMIAAKRFFGHGWQRKLKGITLEDLESSALERLHERSGHKRFEIKAWRIAVAKIGALNLLAKEMRRRKREETTVDRMEGRFEED